jgi:hypothetical protein
MKHGKSVAIVGVGGIFPMSPTLDRFWETSPGSHRKVAGCSNPMKPLTPQSVLLIKFIRRKPASLMTRAIPHQLPASISMPIS